MKAVGLTHYLPISDPQSLIDFELEMPDVTGRDLLVRVQAISVNPVDTKVRKPKDNVEHPPRILGWDAAGVVVQVGLDCSLFKVGDAVFYAGELNRQGSNAQYQLVDERIVGHKPTSLNDAEAAALPLTAITAWESLFERLQIARSPAENSGKSLLIIGGAGGVGSIAIQLASKLAGLTVIATASRPETEQWVRDFGAQHVVNHQQALAPQLENIGFATLDYILCCNDTDAYFPLMAALIKAQGRICSIVETAKPVDINLLKTKSATFVWELMFTRAMFKTDDMIEQHHILNQVAKLVDAGVIQTTLTQTMSPINAANVRLAHAQLESGTTIGKVVLSGWD